MFRLLAFSQDGFPVWVDWLCGNVMADMEHIAGLWSDNEREQSLTTLAFVMNGISSSGTKIWSIAEDGPPVYDSRVWTGHLQNDWTFTDNNLFWN